MLNRFKNVLYGPSTTTDNRLALDFKDNFNDNVIAKRINVLQRSSSFREDLMREAIKYRVDSNKDNTGNQRGKLSTSTSTNAIDSYQSESLPPEHNGSNQKSTKLPKFRYSRPEFLQLKTDDEILVSADHQIRPIILPRDVSRLAWKSGYAECINAGKSLRNEDQAACYQDVLIKKSASVQANDANSETENASLSDKLPWVYFGIFDGHAGTAVAVAAAAQLHNIIGDKLRQISDILIALEFIDDMIDSHQKITVDSLITGALESAFWEMDLLIEQGKHDYKMPGGCTAIVSLFILGKLYVCNAGDSRAIVYKGNQVIPMSFDFTPTTERERILRLGLQHPEFLGNDFTHLEFIKKPTRKELGKQMLYKDAYMTGWSMKTITDDDLKIPLVCGEGKRSRVLATIGVTRGFGDHELRAQYGSLPIKPFLTPEPQVKILPLESDGSLTPEDVLIMGTDGLWDVTSNQEAADVVKNSFDLFPDNEESRSKYRYITAAQDLVIHSRGHTTNWNNVWRTNDERLASLDDIAVFVIPLKQYRDEYVEWRRLRSQAAKQMQGNNNLEESSVDESFDGS